MKIVPLQEATEEHGGKATGLARLMRAGLRVPEGFVVTGGYSHAGIESLQRAWRELDAEPVAVRSSASCEDGAVSSAAGQFDTFLSVDTEGALCDAVERCFSSLDSPRAETYRERLAGLAPATMSVVVQRMVKGAVSGVLFTVDPTGKRELVIEACEGLAEALVAGHLQGEQYRVPRDGSIEERPGLLGATDLSALRADALAAEARFGRPLDMEWSIDEAGRLHWLQARPITGLDGPDLHELDYHPRSADQLFTRANIGEMLPGAATPLTIDLFGGAIDGAMHDLYRAAGAVAPEDRDVPFVCTFGNHLFINLSLLYGIVGRVAGTSPASLEVSILGRELDERPAVSYSGRLRRGLRFLGYLRYVFGHERARRRLERLRDRTFIEEVDEPYRQLQAVQRFRAPYDRATSLHMQASAWSGALNGALREVLVKGGLSRAEQMAAIGALLLDIDGIESAAIVRDLEAIARELEAAPEHAKRSADNLRDWLETHPRSRAGGLFAELLVHHGHRSVREAELRELEWREDPGELVHSLWSMLAAGTPARGKPRTSWQQQLELLLSRHPRVRGRALRFLVPRARAAVAEREHTKSILIELTSRLRRAVRRLGAQLEQSALLLDADLVYFLRIDELRALLDGDGRLAHRAAARRRLLPRQMALTFPDFCKGAPEPMAAGATRSSGDGSYIGLALSGGTSRGPVRVVLSREDARQLRPGEIICARFTDVGWTPYYGIAAGLITEIGSSLSHGAVVAREYRLPLVSNIEGATSLFATGDVVEIDGTDGTVQVVSASTDP